MDAKAFLARLDGLPLAAEPGRAFLYGYSIDVLGCLVEQIDGVPLGLALQRRLSEPLGMRHTSFEQRAAEAVPLAQPEDAAWHATVPAIGVRQPGQLLRQRLRPGAGGAQ